MRRHAIWLLGHAAALAASWAPAQGIRATLEDEKTIRVAAPGRFETTFTMRKGFGATLFDLKHDPERKRDLAPVLDENGLLWTKAAGPGMGDGSWYANPPQKMELLEAGPVRVRVRLSGPHCRYGYTDPKAAWKDLGFEQTFTLYPTGDVYTDYALVTDKPVPLHHFLLIIKSTGAWGKRGKGEVHCAGEAGEKPPYGETASPFALQWSDGPTYFQDILLVMFQGRYKATYWNEGYEDKDVRAGLDLLSRWPDKAVPKGNDHILLLMRFADGLNGERAAAPYANDYRSPDRLTVAEGALDTTDEGDFDADGFNEAEGCYVLKAGAKGVEFTLHGSKIPRTDPAFKVKGWRGDAPKAVRLGSKNIAAGMGFYASTHEGTLLLQVPASIKEDVGIAIGR